MRSPIRRVGDDPVGRDAGRKGAGQHPLSEGELGGEPLRRGDAGLATALRMVRPGTREVEGTIHEGRPLVRSVGQEDSDLGVGGITDRAAVLASDPARLVAFLHEPGVVDDQHPAHRITQMVDHVRSQVIPHRVGVPGRGTQEALDAARPDLADRLGQLPAVLALDPLQQVDQIATGPFPHLRSCEAVGDPSMQLRDRVHPLTDAAPRPHRLPHGHVHALPPRDDRVAQTGHK